MGSGGGGMLEGMMKDFEASLRDIFRSDGSNPFANVLIVSKARFGGPPPKKSRKTT